MPRLIWVFARRTLILLILSCRGSNIEEYHKNKKIVRLKKLTAPEERSSLNCICRPWSDWDYTVCPDLSVRKHRIITVQAYIIDLVFHFFLSQQAAGIYGHLKDVTLSHVQQDPTPDLSPDALNALSSLMVAQGQEAIYRKAATSKLL